MLENVWRLNVTSLNIKLEVNISHLSLTKKEMYFNPLDKTASTITDNTEELGKCESSSRQMNLSHRIGIQKM